MSQSDVSPVNDPAPGFTTEQVEGLLKLVEQVFGRLGVRSGHPDLYATHSKLMQSLQSRGIDPFEGRESRRLPDA